MRGSETVGRLLWQSLIRIDVAETKIQCSVITYPKTIAFYHKLNK